MKKIITATLALALSTSLFGVERPSSQEVSKVMNYYKNGKGQGAILVEMKIAKDIIRKGKAKNEPKAIVVNKTLKKGEKAILWMNFLVPANDKAAIYMEFKNRNKVRKVDELKVSGAIRYRTWKSLPTSRSGEWSVNLSQELGDEDIPLGTIKYTVK